MVTSLTVQQQPLKRTRYLSTIIMEVWEIALFALLSCVFTLILLRTLWEIFGRKPPKDVYLGAQRRG
jgi:hypothetical protein